MRNVKHQLHYFTFQSEEAVANALAKNGSQLNEAPISVVRWRSWRACQVQSIGVAVFGLLHSMLCYIEVVEVDYNVINF